MTLLPLPPFGSSGKVTTCEDTSNFLEKQKSDFKTRILQSIIKSLDVFQVIYPIKFYSAIVCKLLLYHLFGNVKSHTTKLS